MNCRTLLAVLLLLVVCSSTFAITGKPNIIMFNVEDASAKRFGCYGGQGITPNIDKLASEGVLFQNAMVQASVCNPSRCSWLTGLRPTTTKVYGNGDDWHAAVDMIKVTMPQHLRNNGYETVQGGKLFHKVYTEGIHPPSFDIILSEKNSDTPYVNADAPHGGSIKWGAIDAPPEHMRDGHLTASVCNYIEKEHSKPFFIGIGLHSPHLTFSAPKRLFDIYNRDTMKLPRNPEPPADGYAGDQPATEEGWMDVFVAHHACISYVDWCVGQVLDCVKSSGLEDNTIIVFTTDHGFMLGEHWSWRKNQNKHWEETCRVPYIWKVPGVTPANTRSNAMVEMIDSWPTFFDLAGIPNPKGQPLEGRSMKSVLVNPNKRFLKAAYTEGSKDISIQTERFRMNIDTTGKIVALFDHKSDPAEFTNLAQDSAYADEIARLLSYKSNEIWSETGNGLN